MRRISPKTGVSVEQEELSEILNRINSERVALEELGKEKKRCEKEKERLLQEEEVLAKANDVLRIQGEELREAIRKEKFASQAAQTENLKSQNDLRLTKISFDAAVLEYQRLIKEREARLLEETGEFNGLIKNHQAGLRNTEDELKNALARLASLAERKDSLEKDISSYQEILNKTRGEMAARQNELTLSEAQVEEVKEALSFLKEQRVSSVSELNDVLGQLKEQKQALSVLIEEKEQLNCEIKEKKLVRP